MWSFIRLKPVGIIFTNVSKTKLAFVFFFYIYILSMV